MVLRVQTLARCHSLVPVRTAGRGSYATFPTILATVFHGTKMDSLSLRSTAFDMIVIRERTAHTQALGYTVAHVRLDLLALAKCATMQMCASRIRVRTVGHVQIVACSVNH